MKKLKNPTGLAKQTKAASATARKDSSGKAGKVSNKKQAKQRKTAKLQEKKASKASQLKKRKQGGKGRPYQPKPWEAYAPKGPNVMNYTREELEQTVRRASGAANRRLKRLEEAGETKGMYKRALGMLETQGRTKFSGAVKSMTRNELIAEYLRLRDFLSAKTSTIQGIKSWKHNIYLALKERDFEGTEEELTDLFDRFMTKEMEDALGSNPIFVMLRTEKGRSLLDRAKDAIDRAKETKTDPKRELSRVFNISTEEQAEQILAMYFGG